MTLGNYLKEMSLSQSDVARAWDMPQSMISAILDDRNAGVATVLQISLETRGLVGWKEVPMSDRTRAKVERLLVLLEQRCHCASSGAEC